nr:hypothetical protein CFP56_72822 [Quercus suber]
MTSQGPVAPFPLPLLVKDKEYVMDTTHSIIRDADLDECLKHETDPLDSSLFYQGLVRMQALQICCSSCEASIKCLKDRLESEADALKKFKESSQTYGQESEVAALHERMDKVKEKAIEEYQVSQPYINEMGGYYGEGLKDFRKQAVLMFPNLGFS